MGLVADDLHLDMYLQLKRSPEQEEAARQFVESLTDKTSPNFHKWITAAEYGRRFGVAAEDIATVTRWLESHGFTVNGVPANNMVIDFSGTAGQVRGALHTEIHNLEVAGKPYFANISDPQIPAALLPAVTGVVSLNNFRPHPMLVPKRQYTVNSYTVPVVPGDLATIYNLNAAFAGGYTGQGQTIVVVEDTDLYNGTGDWTAFRRTFGLNQYQYGSLTQVHPAPGSGGGTCSDPGVNGNDAEAALDVEWASAAAPNAAIVMASCADSSTNFGGFIALQNMLSNGGALPSVVSISYGESETAGGATFNAYINTLYQTAAAAGVSVFVASGDSAAVGNDRSQDVAVHGITVSSFASTIYNVAVGGTDFGDTAAGTMTTFWNAANGTYFDSAKSYVPEIPWNDSCAGSVFASYRGFSATYGPSGSCNSMYIYLNTDGGSGGPSGCATGATKVPAVVSGTCAGYAKPSWQSIFGNPSDGVRDLPDVSLFSAPGLWGHYYVFCLSEGTSCAGPPSTWYGGGGTSFASPIMAGIQALINQALGTNHVGNPNPVYYQVAQNQYGTAASRAACNSTTGPASTCAFNDITQGDIDVPCAGVFNCYLGGGGLGVLSTSNSSYQPAYATTPGWDFATGIGTVNAFGLLKGFVSSVAPANAPAAPSLISPANGATGVSPGTALTWSVSAGVSSYDVYFGTSSTPPLLASTVDLNYAPGGMTAGTTYYWAIGARNSLGANVSNAWSFTTGCISALTVSSATMPSSGGTGTIPVSAATGCTWTAVSNVSWITITSGASGSGNGTVGYTVAAGGQRNGTITVAGQTFTVTQAYPLITRLAGGAMPLTAAQGTSISIPVSYGVAVDSTGNAYFPSPNLNAVFMADPTGVVTRIAGTGAPGHSGDSGPALSAQLNGPNGVAVDVFGNVYIADTKNQRVRKVDRSGVITTVAGTGSCCYGGDGGAAASALLNAPNGVAADSQGNLYIVDTGNQRIRKVDASGVITTVAGTGTAGYSGDGGAATGAEVSSPDGMAVDASGNLYIADTINGRIRKVDQSGNISTVAGTGSCCYSGDGGAAPNARLGYPAGVAVDGAGNLYIADTINERIRKVNVAGTIITIAGSGDVGYSGDGGPAPSAHFYGPEGVALDASGNVYVTDSGNARIRVVSASGVVTTLVGGSIGDGGWGVFGALNQPYGVARDNAGNTYIADAYNNRVRKVSANGAISTVAGTGALGFAGDNGPATSAKLFYPTGVALDASGNLYIADTNNSRIRKVDGSGNITTVAGNGMFGYSGDGGPAAVAQLGSPYGLAVDAGGNLYISDGNYNVVRKVAGGTIATVAGNGTLGYSGDGGAALSATMRGPWGLAVDGSGNLYIADRYNYRIRMVSTGGTIKTVAGNGNCCFGGDGGQATNANLYDPTGVALDSAGNLYITDYYNNRVRMVSAVGIITTVAGNGGSGLSGDGGPATSATLQYPWGISVDAAGTVAVADSYDNAVRLLIPGGTQPVLSVQSAHSGNFTPGSTGAYTVTVNNAAMAGATTGVVTVTEMLPAALTLAGMSGSGWGCSGNTCVRSDSLSGGASYPPITVTVNVSAAPPSQVTNQVAVSGGGAVTAGAGDLTLVTLPTVLTITKTHTGNFSQGQAGATYTVTVSSPASAAPANGPVKVTDVLPPGLTLVSMTGAGWTCSSNSCSRSDSLAASSSYPPITVTVNVASNATSPQVNSVSVSAGGVLAASATDSTLIGGSCSYAINPNSQSFLAAGGNGTISVTASDGCAWGATSGLSWATITAGGNGSGNGTVTYQVAANTGQARSGSLTVAGLPFSVQQAGVTGTALVSLGSMAQLASGGPWNSTITLVNAGTTVAEVVLNFFDDNGNALVLPLIFPGTSSGAPLQASTLDQIIAAGAQLVIQTAGTASQPTVQGWVQLLANGGNVGGAAVFAWATPMGTQEAVVPLETRSSSAFVLPFDYTGGYGTGVAVANLSNQPVSIPVVLRDNTGASLGTAASISLPPHGHTAFMLLTNYPAVAGKLGTMELDTPSGAQISALGIRAAPDGAITTVPVLAK
ncbi:MAG TPA: protease pro-enzyme activation domain-containing protein [Bryobacteraceae bacterium]|nr:protease pro-enzyme activation domain-containing protein [Bryobacteraceae bacterium]